MLQKIESVLDKYVRPELARHEGNVQVVSYEDGILRVRLYGQCANCPSGLQTTEELIGKTVMAQIPEVKDVVLVTGVSDDLLNFARQMLADRKRS